MTFILLDTEFSSECYSILALQIILPILAYLFTSMNCRNRWSIMLILPLPKADWGCIKFMSNLWRILTEHCGVIFHLLMSSFILLIIINILTAYGVEPRPSTVRTWGPNNWTARESIIPLHYRFAAFLN